MPNPVEIVGYVAGTMIVVSYVPQAIRAWRTREVKDLSWLMLVLLLAANALWIVYGVMSKQMPVIVTNAATLVTTGAVFAAKVAFRGEG